MTQVRLLSAYAGAGGTVGYPGDVTAGAIRVAVFYEEPGAHA